MTVVPSTQAPTAPAGPPLIRRPAPGAIDIVLPDAPSVPSDDFGTYTTLLYGPKKIGKTSLCAQFPDSFFFMFEPGGKGFSLRQLPMVNWETFLATKAKIKATPGYARTLVVDTVDAMYESCFAYVCRKENMNHPADEAWGKGWKAISKEFMAAFNDLLSLGCGVICTSHAQITTFKKPNGFEFNKMTPTVSGQAEKFITAVMDNLMYYGYYGEDRMLTIQGSDAVEAGTRCHNNFWVKDTFDGSTGEVEYVFWEKPNPEHDGVEDSVIPAMIPCEQGDEGAIRRVRYVEETLGQRVHSIPTGNGPRDAYINIQKAFKNLQETDGRPEKGTGFREMKVNPFKKK